LSARGTERIYLTDAAQVVRIGADKNVAFSAYRTFHGEKGRKKIVMGCGHRMFFGLNRMKKNLTPL
jgi:hypothetical protein